MNASASDLKSAYVYFTRAAVILSDIVPEHNDFAQYELQFPGVEKVMLIF